MGFDILEIIRKALLWVIPIFVAVVFHEVAHGYAALKLGDTTARDSGRLTLNPIPHIDPMGTVIIPLLLLAINSPFLFGYAKPVPVNFFRLKNPKRDMIFVAAAGPASNFMIAIIAAIFLRAIFIFYPAVDLGSQVGFPQSLITTGVTILLYTYILSVVLGIFNLTPVPPLDGGRIVVGLLPDKAAENYSRVEPFGIFIVIGLLFLTPLNKVFGIAIFLISYIMLGGEIASKLLGLGG
ncbi:MAG: site-2 protease family protein [Deltaproteobacteria bacterium]|uniref:Site-2 protease family protein n=1 Tax=Candidatus Zymogenus saltonus TaxID=2844893 RepID=A0A9D8PP41_9DELT|nr:site-2 protease family protein [Candidatus Zymogenus saltonus]